MSDLVAWIVSPHGVGQGDEVVFARNADTAWEEHACSEECTASVECECYPARSIERKPGFDQFSPGPVPLRAFHRDGWHWKCHYCDAAGALHEDEYSETGDWQVVDVDGKEIAICNECIREVSGRGSGGE